MRKLVITEKASVARRISAILSNKESQKKVVNKVSVISFSSNGDDYDVVSLRGHIIELDYSPEFSDWTKISLTDLVYAPQVKIIRSKNILDTIVVLLQDADEIIIATDFDREGELIGLETVIAANADMSIVKRARFSALIKRDVENAFKNLSSPDQRLADAAEARQIIDLSWGAVLTRSISVSSGQIGKNFLSVGRVQSPTLKLLVDRHEEIVNFTPVPYWRIVGKFGDTSFKGEHENNQFWEEEEAHAILEKCLLCKDGRVELYECLVKEEPRPIPFDTTRMQVEANKIGISPVTAMKLAEELYIGGYISYPRTENTEYPKNLNLRNILEKLKESDFRAEVTEILKQDSICPSRGKKRTTDHPPIYPTNGASSSRMKGDKWKLYELIVRRFLATVGGNAEAEITKCVVNVANEKFNAEGYVLKKKGWKKYYKKYITTTNIRIPKLEIGSSVEIKSVSVMEEETKPPRRYNQGSLIQEMDRLDLGTKSTRHEIIGKLYSRSYVQGNNMVPTASGIALVRSLTKHGGGIAEPGMTAKLESDMLEIMRGEKTLDFVVKESQDLLYRSVVTMESEMEAIGNEIREALKVQQFLGKCPDCGGNMIIKRSTNGKFIGCDGFPNCKQTYPFPNGAMVQTVETVCKVCKLPQLKVIRSGMPPQVVCINPKCQSNVEANTLGTCPTCKVGVIRIVYSKRGKRFAGCSRWPDCSQSYFLRRGGIIPTNKACGVCGAPIIILGDHEECINSTCSKKTSKSVNNLK
ncbi:MAG: DNA topoisomerase I [archaeon]|nr:DNA topoisomerase I [archaeon]